MTFKELTAVFALEAHNFKFGVRTKLKKGTNFYFYINKP